MSYVYDCLVCMWEFWLLRSMLHEAVHMQLLRHIQCMRWINTAFCYRFSMVCMSVRNGTSRRRRFCDANSAQPTWSCQLGAGTIRCRVNSTQNSLGAIQTVTDTAPKCLRADSPAPYCPDAELASPNRRRQVVLDPMSVCLVLSQPRAVLKRLNRSRSRLGCELGWAPGTVY